MDRKDLFKRDHILLTKYMTDKIRENKRKETWENTQIEDLIDFLEDEVIELLKAHYYDEGNEAICRECADVANFAMMIVGNIERERNEI
jgi:NTP pyrophosphatase (non-canonical NTP hydrolase)